MQSKIVKIIFTLFLLIGTASLHAQTGKDSIMTRNIEWTRMDSSQKKMHFKRMKMDSVHAKLLKRAKADGFRYKNRDSLIVFDKLDSLHMKMKLQRFKSDSFHLKKMDSLHFKFKTMKLDSMHVKMNFRSRLDSFHYKNDSLHIKFKTMRKDTMRMKMHLRGKLDSFHFKKMDSLHFKFKKMKMDSMHMKFKMEKLDCQLKKMKIELKKNCDSVHKKAAPAKAIGMQVTCAPDAVVDIRGLARNIRIRPSGDNKVRLETSVNTEPGPKSSDEELFSKAGIELKVIENLVTVSSPETGAAVNRTNSKKTLTIYVPSNAKVKVDNKFADLNIAGNMRDIEIVIANGNLVMGDADKAVIKSSNGFVKAAVIKNGDIELNGCRFVCESIDNLKINSKYSNVSFANSSALSFTSVSDHYDIKQVTDVQGDKTFGELKILNLKNSIVLNGSSADVKIKNIEGKAALVKIDNKYAALKLPVGGLENYSVDFDGSRSNVSAPFEKRILTIPAPPANKEVLPLPAPPIFKNQPEKTRAGNNNVNANFTAAVGDVNSGHTKFQINCSSCIIDFN